MGIIFPLFVMNIDFTSHGWASNSFYIHVTNETLWCNKVYYFTNICFIFIITKTPQYLSPIKMQCITMYVTEVYSATINVFAQ